MSAAGGSWSAVPRQTLKYSLQIAYTYRHEINAGILTCTVKIWVYQKGTGKIALSHIQECTQNQTYPLSISYKSNFISVISNHLQKVHLLTLLVSRSALPTLSTICLTDIQALWKIYMGFSSSSLPSTLRISVKDRLSDKMGHIDKHTLPDKKPSKGGEALCSLILLPAVQT